MINFLILWLYGGYMLCTVKDLLTVRWFNPEEKKMKK